MSHTMMMNQEDPMALYGGSVEEGQPTVEGQPRGACLFPERLWLGEGLKECWSHWPFAPALITSCLLALHPDTCTAYFSRGPKPKVLVKSPISNFNHHCILK